MIPGRHPEPVAFHPRTSRLPPIFERLTGSEVRSPSAMLLVTGERARRRGWSGATAITLAGLIGQRGRRVILADLALDSPELHEPVGQPNDEGVTDMLLFGASLNYVARRAPEAAFHFAPAGAYAAEPRTVFEHGRWDDMLRSAENDGSLLLLHVPAAIDGVEIIAGRVRRAIILAGNQDELDHIASQLPEECRIDAALVPGSAAPDGDGDESPAGEEAVPSGESVPPSEEDLDEEVLIRELASIGRQSRRRRGRRLVAVLLLFGVLGAGGWFGYDRYRGRIAEYLSMLDVLERQDSTPDPVDGVIEQPRPIDTPLPYSVVIASYDALDPALERVAELRDDYGENIGFYLAPIVIDGTVYYRLLAGPSAEVATAESLMQRLVEIGVMEAEQPWALRNTAWAYHIGDFDTRAAARTRQQELQDMDIPNYMIEVPYTAGPSRYRLYAGAYAGAAEADVLARILDEAGIEAPLVRRVGQPVQ